MNPFTSRVLKYIARSSLAFPILYIFLAATLFDIPLHQCPKILLALSYWFVSIFVFIAGFGFLKVQRWAWYVFIFSQLLLLAENITLVLNYSESHNKIMALIVSVFFQAGIIYLVNREIRGPYFFPRIRWWESDPRYRLAVPFHITRASGEKLSGTLLDISTIGCFVKLRSDIHEGETLRVSFEIFRFKIDCDATVVWCAPSTVTHPKGIGLKFNTLEKAQRKSLLQIKKRIKKINALYKKYRIVLSQDDFVKKLTALELSPSESKFQENIKEELADNTKGTLTQEILQKEADLIAKQKNKLRSHE